MKDPKDTSGKVTDVHVSGVQYGFVRLRLMDKGCATDVSLQLTREAAIALCLALDDLLYPDGEGT